MDAIAFRGKKEERRLGQSIELWTKARSHSLVDASDEELGL